MKLLTIIYFIFISVASVFSGEPEWKHFFIDDTLPGNSYGTGGPVVAEQGRNTEWLLV